MPEQKDDLLATRYGQKKARPGRFRWLAYGGVAAMTIGAVGLGLANWSPIQATTISFRVVSPWVTEVDFEIQMPPGSVAVCELEALNNAFAVVGYVKQSFAIDVNFQQPCKYGVFFKTKGIWDPLSEHTYVKTLKLFKNDFAEIRVVEFR